MKIDISQRQILEFLIEVDGTNIDEVKSRLILSENDLMIGVEGKTSVQDDGQAKLVFTIPELKNIIHSQSVGAKIEMFVENKFYVPYETSIDIERPVSFKVNEGKIDETKKSPFAVKNPKIIVEKAPPSPKAEQPLQESVPDFEDVLDSLLEQEEKKVHKDAFDFNELLSEFESHGSLEKLKMDTIDLVKHHEVYKRLSEDSRERIAVLKSKRVKTEDLYFNIMKSVLSEMTKLGVNVILE